MLSGREVVIIEALIEDRSFIHYMSDEISHRIEETSGGKVEQFELYHYSSGQTLNSVEVAHQYE